MALTEYFKARNTAMAMPNIDISKIEKRILDMKLRIGEETFAEIEKQYAE